MSKPILFGAGETNFTGNGLGRLSDAINCVVEEKINGKYELEMMYPVDGIHFSDLAEHRYLYCPHDDTGTFQPFEIYRISRPINGKVTVFAAHISYKLNKMLVKPFTDDAVGTALGKLESEAIDAMPFTFATDKTNSGNINIEVPMSIRSVMGGVQGSILDVYGGEWEFDHWQCMLRSRRGDDNGVSIRYGKNLVDVTKVSDSTNLWTGIVPYWRGTDPDLNAEIIIMYNGVIYSNNHEDFAYPMNIAVDASSYFEDPPTQAQLQTWGQLYVNNNAKAGIPSTLTISFIQLWQTEEYKDIAPLQRLRLGDTLNVFYEKLGVNNTARVVAYKYNVLLDRYDSMTVGEVQATLASTIQKGIDDAVKELPSKSFFEQALDRAAKLIEGGYGGHVVINTNEAGQPNEILVMNTADKTTATRVMRINYEGIAFGTGYNGPWNSAWTTLDGTFDAQNINVIHLSASSIDTGTMSAARILGGTLRLGGSNNTNGQITVYDAAGNIIGSWTKDGLDVKSGTIKGPSIILGGSGNGNGTLTIYDGSNNVIGSLSKDGASLTGDIVMKKTVSNIDIITKDGYVDYPSISGDTVVWNNDLGFSIEKYTNNTRTGYFGIVPFSQILYEVAYATTEIQKAFVLGTTGRGFILDVKSDRFEMKSYGDSSGYLKVLRVSDTGVYISSYGGSVSTSGTSIKVASGNNDYYIQLISNTIYIYAGTQYITGNSGYLYYNGSQLAFASSSSKRYKHDIKLIEDIELDPHKLLDLKVVQFVFNDDHKPQYEDMKGKVVSGFIAEDVAEIYPSAVIHHPETGEIESWDERRIIPPMLSLIQEQCAKIEVLEERINKLEILLEEVLKK